MANFRQQYISRLVGDEREASLNDLKKLLDARKDYNLDKVREFSWMFKIPDASRRQIWMILFHILPEFRTNDDRVITGRRQEAEILFNCLRTCRELECFCPPRSKQASGESLADDESLAARIQLSARSTRSTTEESLSDSDSDETVVIGNAEDGSPESASRSLSTNVGQEGAQQTCPTPADLSVMVLLSEGLIEEKHLLHRNYAHYIAVAEHMIPLCGAAHWTDTFHLTRALLLLMRKTYPDEATLVCALQKIHAKLEEEIGMNSALCERSTFARIPIRLWLFSGGAQIVKSHRAIHRLWDKLVTGEAVTLLMQSLVVDYLSTIDKKFGDEVDATAFYHLTEEGEMRMVKRVLNEVNRNGGRKSASEIRQKRLHNIL